MGRVGKLLDELRRRKVIRVAIAYGVTAWVVVHVAETVYEPMLLPAWSVTLVAVLAILGFPMAVTLAWALGSAPTDAHHNPVAPEASASPSPAPAAEARATEQPASPPEASVAVLPFADMSQERDQGYLCDGIAEEILNGLVHIRGLKVAARTSSFQFRGFAGNIGQIARELQVAAVLEGSVRKSGNRLRINAQLIATKDGFNLWSDSYDVVAADVFAVQEKIAASIASALRVTLDAEDRLRMQRGQTRSLEAYDHYLRGLSYFHAFSWRTMEYARQMFLRAIEIDPGFGRAWAGLAYAAGYIYLYRQPDDKYRQEALDASARALACCDTAEGHTARGVALGLTKDYAAADLEFRKALEADPDQYEALWLYGRLAHERGDFRRAAELWQRATTVNGEDYQAALLLPQVFMAMGQPARAREWQQRGLKRALRHLDLYPDDVRALYLSAVTHAALGQHEQARKAAARALQLEPDDGIVLYNLACMHVALHEPGPAVALLERGATTLGRINPAWLEHDSTLAPLKGTPRFEALLARLRG